MAVKTILDLVATRLLREIVSVCTGSDFGLPLSTIFGTCTGVTQGYRTSTGEMAQGFVLDFVLFSLLRYLSFLVADRSGQQA